MLMFHGNKNENHYTLKVWDIKEISGGRVGKTWE
jgi:hypothetical protein